MRKLYMMGAAMAVAMMATESAMACGGSAGVDPAVAMRGTKGSDPGDNSYKLDGGDTNIEHADTVNTAADEPGDHDSGDDGDGAGEDGESDED